MAKILKTLIRKTFLNTYDNLVALDDPYYVLDKLLRRQNVNGILDAGGSNGRVTKKLLRFFPDATAYLFEPNPDYKETLENLASENARIKPQFIALSDKSDTAELNITSNIGSTSLFQPNKQFSKSHPNETALEKTVSITTQKLDDWVEENGNPTIELMKFDIQSGELLALKGAKKTLLSSTLVIYTEIFFNPMYEHGAIFSEIDLFLREFGFVLYNIYKPMSDDNGLLNQANAVYIHAEKIGI